MAQQDDSIAAVAGGQPAMESTINSSGLDASAKDAGTDLNAPYGTRSRQRNGNARPNYAEDKDMDMDFYESHSARKDGESKRPPRQINADNNGDATRVGTSSRKVVADETKAGNSHASQSNAKEQDAGGATGAPQSAAVSTAGQPSRKRKAAAQQHGGVTIVATKKGANAVQTPTSTLPESNMLTFEDSQSRPVDGRLTADDGTVLGANDHVYLVCEPPGEPYYLGRIMEFLHAQNDSSRPVDAVRINWYYRPKDIGRKVHDTRLVFATMHSDISPLTALRGKCQIRHRVEVDNMELYRKTPDSFWFEKLYDRYIQKNYDLIPTAAIVNVPEKVKKVLDERWKYVLVEQGRGKELTSAVKLCKRCTGYCASNDSVDCAVCHFTYHMDCVKPPLLKKPSRGFAWSCAACSRAQERRLEAQHTPNAVDSLGDAEDEELVDEDEEDVVARDTGRTSPEDEESHQGQGTAEQIYHASLWPYRYLGMHCKPEDALDYDDRIYPRAGTRLGPRHQAAAISWPGRPVEYVKPVDIKKSGRKDGKLSKEVQAALEAEKLRREQRPKWIQDEPPGYVARGEDYDETDPKCTATPMWRPPPSGTALSDDFNSYTIQAQDSAAKLSLPERSTNLRDVAVASLFRSGYDPKKAIDALMATERNVFKEPSLSAAEQKRFEEGIAKYGSELHQVMKHVKTLTPGEIVRYYYTWKKSERGLQVWGEYSGRKGKKEAKRVEAAASKMADEVANRDDDSAFDAGKAAEKKRAFRCQFCAGTQCRQWRRAPNPTPGLVNLEGKSASKEKGGQYIVALCRRCAELWRRYAVRFEDIDEVIKKVAQAGGRAWKRRQDEELLKELQAAQELGFMNADRESPPLSVTGQSNGNGQEPPRKKLKGAPEDQMQSDGGSVVAKKKEKQEPVVDIVPEIPKPRTLPCAICDQMEPLGDQHVSCRECRLTVHRTCYGIVDTRMQGKWICDMCTNDKNPQVSVHYKCVLCPVEFTEHDFVELPKLTHHKKKLTDREREREKLEVQQARKAADFYRRKQEELNRPSNPREPLKRTADNNWVHVTCAVWTPEVKFGNAKAMEPSEGVASIPRSRYDEVCQACGQNGGACVACHHCRVPLHVECARHHGYVLGFDITPVKGSRRDQHNIVTVNGESGTMSAAIWCKDHVPTKTVVHRMHEMVDDTGLNALQLYAQSFKQADLTLTGTVRKANLMTQAAKMSSVPVQAAARRHSTTTMPNGVNTASRSAEQTDVAGNALEPGAKICISCGVDVSLKWWPIAVDETQDRQLTNGYHGTMGSEARMFMEQRRFQCHRCHKEHRSPKPPMMQAPAGTTDAPRAPPVAEGAPLETNLARPMVPLRSPPPLPPSSMAEYRDAGPPSHAWPPHPLAQAGPPHAGPPSALPPVSVAAQAHASVTGSLPHPAAHGYSPVQPGRAIVYHDWGQRPGSQHGSPPRLLNGGPPPMVNGRPLPTTSALRPPIISGPPPTGPPIGMVHPHLHASPVILNGVPHSPRQLSGPPPPPAYQPPFNGGSVGGQGPPPPPPHGAPHGMTNGGGSPTFPRSDPFHHGLHSHRPPFAADPYGSPPGGSRNGIPAVYERPATAGSPPRSSDGRPASGASASASLRNLIS